jgi:hypothetical protein
MLPLSHFVLRVLFVHSRRTETGSSTVTSIQTSSAPDISKSFKASSVAHTSILPMWTLLEVVDEMEEAEMQGKEGTEGKEGKEGKSNGKGGKKSSGKRSNKKARKAARSRHSPMVTAMTWNPLYPDLLAVAYGSFDFQRQGKGLGLY